MITPIIDRRCTCMWLSTQIQICKDITKTRILSLQSDEWKIKFILTFGCICSSVPTSAVFYFHFVFIHLAIEQPNDLAVLHDNRQTVHNCNMTIKCHIIPLITRTTTFYLCTPVPGSLTHLWPDRTLMYSGWSDKGVKGEGQAKESFWS